MSELECTFANSPLGSHSSSAHILFACSCMSIRRSRRRDCVHQMRFQQLNQKWVRKFFLTLIFSRPLIFARNSSSCCSEGTVFDTTMLVSWAFSPRVLHNPTSISAKRFSLFRRSNFILLRTSTCSLSFRSLSCNDNSEGGYGEENFVIKFAEQSLKPMPSVHTFRSTTINRPTIFHLT